MDGVALAVPVGGRHIRTMQENKQEISILAIPPEKICSQPAEGSLQELFEIFFQNCHLLCKPCLYQLRSPLSRSCPGSGGHWLHKSRQEVIPVQPHVISDISRTARAREGISKDDFISITIAGIAALWLDSGFPLNYVIPKPFLLTHGAQDRANGNVYPKQAKAWAAHEPNCRYEIIPDAGHTAHMDNPVAFNAILLDFLKSQEKP